MSVCNDYQVFWEKGLGTSKFHFDEMEDVYALLELLNRVPDKTFGISELAKDDPRFEGSWGHYYFEIVEEK